MAPDVLAERALPDLPSARGGRWRWRFVVGIGLSLLLLAAAAVLGWREQQSHREQAAMQAELVIDGIERQLRERLLHLAADLAAHAAASSRADVSDARPPQAHLHASAIRRALVIDAGGRRVDGSAARIPALPPRGDGLQLLPPEPGAGAVLALWDGTPGVRVLAEVDPGWFAELLQGHALAEGAVLNLVHASQRIYARSHDNDAHLGRDLAGAALFSPAHLARGSGRYEEDSVLSGEPRQFVYRRVADTPLAIVIGTPSASIASQTQAFVVVLLLTALVLGGIWLWLLREFGRGERRQAQLLQRLQQAQQLAMVGTWRWRIDADTIEWGGDSARIYGFPAETTEVALDEVLSRMHPDDLKTVTHWLQLARTDPAAVVGLTVEYRVIRDDGSLCWVLGRVETDDHGDARSLFGVQQDVSEQVRVRERLHLAQDMARIGDWEWDVASGRIRWSRTMYDIYGLDPDAFTPDAENAFLRIHPEDRARVQRYGTALVETGEACEAEFRIVRPDGEVRVISARGMRETAADGRIVIRSVQQDVTELAQARDRLREAEEQYRYLFERNPVPMWVFDRDTLAFIAVNDAMLRHYGYGREELLVGSILDIRPPGERARVEASAREATDERPQGQVWTHLRKDGTPLRMAIFTQDIVFDGRPARMVAAQDVTEREANEQRFRLVARATSDAIYDYDVASNHIWWSESFHAAFGLDPDTVVASLGAWESLVHPEDLPRVSASLERALQAADVEEWQEAYRFRRGDGSYAEVVDRGFFVRDESGRAMRMVGGMLDMSEEYRRESDLRLLRRALEATESGILIADVLQPQLPVVYVNQGFLEMTGYSAAEVLGHDSLFLDFDPRDLEVVREIRRCAHEHRELRTLLRIRRKDGSLFWNDFYMAPVLDDAGQVTHMISVSTDVSERQLAEERFRLVTRATSDVVWDWDLLNEVTWRSDNVFSLFGYERDEIIGSMSGWSALLHPDDRGRVEASIRSAMDSGATGWECDYRLRRKDGSYADVMDRGFLLRDESGRAVRAVGGMLDVTQKNRDAADLRLLRRAVESTDNGIVIADARQPDTPLVYVNPAFEKMTGYAAAECVGRNCRFLQGEDREQIGLDAVRRALHEGEEARAVLRNYRKDGTLFWNELHVAPVRGEDGVVSHYVGVQSDVSHRHHYEQELAHRATHDQLTGLPNRQLLMDRLQQAILNADRYGRKAGVVFIDLDDFKLINDNLDHAAGDQALRIVAERLRTLTRETDTVGRFGGDEFVVVLTEQTDEDGVGQVISRISNALSQPMQIGGIEHTLTPSIGWSRYPDGGRDPETLLKHADMAMYQAKRRGRNQAVAYSPELDVQASQRLQLLAQLRDALQREEFVLAFQPLFDRDGRAVALEALVRWQHPERGLLLPGEFIGVCEESGLIIELGRLVLREAARHHPLLVAAGHGGVRLAVNVSALQFGYALEHDIAVVMEEFALPRGILEIEITESVIMENPDRAIEAMRRISALGVCLSVDDFGTGYSSLTYLKRLPIHRLKIDRSFVQDLPADQEAASICDSIIGLAHSLGLKTVGEGVETEAQLKWLRGNGCDEVQGYLMARPAPFDEVLCLLSANRCSSTA